MKLKKLIKRKHIGSTTSYPIYHITYPIHHTRIWSSQRNESKSSISDPAQMGSTPRAAYPIQHKWDWILTHGISSMFAARLLMVAAPHGCNKREMTGINM